MVGARSILSERDIAVATSIEEKLISTGHGVSKNLRALRGLSTKQDGFTIIEISLVFAISGLLLASMLAGISLSIQRQRFSDAVNGTQSFLQQQYNETQVTINDRSADNCGPESRGASDCLVIGKVIDIGKGDGSLDTTPLHSYQVIIDQAAADAAINAPSPPGDEQLLNDTDGDAVDANTQVIQSTQGDQDYEIPWGAKLTTIADSAGKTSPSGTSDLRYLLIVRSPISGIISTYKLDISKDVELFDTNTSYPLAGHIKPFDAITGPRGQSVNGCIGSADLVSTKALLKIAPGSTQDSVTVQFDTPDKSAWCD